MDIGGRTQPHAAKMAGRRSAVGKSVKIRRAWRRAGRRGVAAYGIEKHQGIWAASAGNAVAFRASRARAITLLESAGGGGGVAEVGQGRSSASDGSLWMDWTGQ